MGPDPAREARILDAAKALLLRYGYDKTTMSDVAAEAGVSKGALYLHYSSKEELFEDLLLREMVAYSETWAARLAASDAALSFRSLYTVALGTLRDNPLLTAMTLQDKRVLGRLLDDAGRGNLLTQRYEVTRALIRQMQAAGVARDDIHADTTAYLFTMLAYGYFRVPTLVPGIEPPTDVLLDAIGALFEEAVMKPDADADVVKAHILGLAAMARQGVDQMRAMRQARRDAPPTPGTASDAEIT